MTGIAAATDEHSFDGAHSHEPRPHFVCYSDDDKKRRTLKLALGLTASILIVEIVGGLISNSLALLSDAGHVGADVFSLALALFALYLACQPATPRATYGYHRVEILAALINGLVLILIALFIFAEAYERLVAPPEVRSFALMVAAIIGLVVNVIVALKLHGHGHHDLNMRGAYLHVLGDTLSSIAVITGGLVIIFTGFMAIDPLLSFGIGAVILIGAVRLIHEGVNILLGYTPKHIDFDKLVGELNAIPGILEVHDVHIWTICSNIHALSAHVLVEKDMAVSETKRYQDRIGALLSQKYNIRHTSLQFEADHCGGAAICEMNH